jgi:hypothetical protein
MPAIQEGAADTAAVANTYGAPWPPSLTGSIIGAQKNRQSDQRAADFCFPVVYVISEAHV